MTTETASQSPVPQCQAAEWWRGAVIYQIYPRSFADSNGDGIGDLPGITAHLEHVASLGVDGIWISPFFTSPMKDFGYDVADYCDVDPIFGTLEDFDALLEEARRLGLKVIIDQVYSHTSDQHAWFQESRQNRTNAKADWYVWADPKPDGSPPTNWQSVFGAAAWCWDSRRGQYYLHNFLQSQPDLNVHNREVQDALLETMRFWLERGVDGFRLDAVNFAMHDPLLRDNPVNPTAKKRTRPFDFQLHTRNQSHPDIPRFLERLRALVQSYGDRFLVAEVGGETALEEMKLYTETEARLHSAYGFFYLYAEDLTADLVRHCAAEWDSVEGDGWPAWTFSNHDAPRAVSRWAKGRDCKTFSDMLPLLLVSLRGSVFLYQGEELGLPQAEVAYEHLQDPEAIMNWPQTLGRDGARTPLPWRSDAPHAGFSDEQPWLPVGPTHHALAVDLQEADPRSTLNLTRQWLGLRQTHAALRTGDLVFIGEDPDLLVFRRGAGHDAILCTFNLGFQDNPWTLPDGWVPIASVNVENPEGGALPALGAVLARRRR